MNWSRDFWVSSHILQVSCLCSIPNMGKRTPGYQTLNVLWAVVCRQAVTKTVNNKSQGFYGTKEINFMNDRFYVSREIGRATQCRFMGSKRQALHEESFMVLGDRRALAGLQFQLITPASRLNTSAVICFSIGLNRGGDLGDIQLPPHTGAQPLRAAEMGLR